MTNGERDEKMDGIQKSESNSEPFITAIPVHPKVMGSTRVSVPVRPGADDSRHRCSNDMTS